nr:acetate--CoA ligase family protein [Sphingomonas formosensis]
MTIRNLQTLFNPGSIALIGASQTKDSVGAIVLEQLLSGGFDGRIYAVNPHEFDREGISCFATIGDLPEAPDLAIVMVPAQAVPDVIAELGSKGTRLAVVLSAGLTPASGLCQKMLEAARPYCLRIIGPNCLGVMMPRVKLNATFACTRPRAGGLALISQSGALITAIVDWAEHRGIGFSGIISAGDMADVDLGDLLDLFAVDPATEAILLYVEGVTNSVKFMSAARAAARSKPVIAIKAGRTSAAARAALSHTGALAGSYDVYRAAFERAGIILVDTLTEMFDAAEILGTRRRARGNRLAIVTNGGGAAVLAIDVMDRAGAELAILSEQTVATLDALLPSSWSHANPVDLIGDGGPERYRHAIGAVQADEGVDAVLVMHCPTATADTAAVAQVVVDCDAAAGRAKPILACWLGDINCEHVRSMMHDAAIALYATPDDAVRGFGYLIAARRSEDMLRDAVEVTTRFSPDRPHAKSILNRVRAERRTVLSEVEAKDLLAAYQVPVVPTRLVRGEGEFEEACAHIQPPYVVKIVSPDLTHKSDAGGVALHLADRNAVMAAAAVMETRIRQKYPEAEIRDLRWNRCVSVPLPVRSSWAWPPMRPLGP